MHSDEFVEEMVREARLRAEGGGGKLAVFGAREGLELKIE
jgi:hypothetical protein